MISFLRGSVHDVTDQVVIFLVGGVGYKVNVTSALATSLKNLHEEQDLWIYMSVREDAQDLYGFGTRSELSFFEKLLKIPGIGPKSALGVLAAAPIDVLRDAIVSENVGYLTKISGIGKKTAEKMVLELKDKLGAFETGTSNIFSGDIDALEALKALGYPIGDARGALGSVPASVTGTSARVSEALRILGGNK